MSFAKEAFARVRSRFLPLLPSGTYYYGGGTWVRTERTPNGMFGVHFLSGVSAELPSEFFSDPPKVAEEFISYFSGPRVKEIAEQQSVEQDIVAKQALDSLASRVEEFLSLNPTPSEVKRALEIPATYDYSDVHNTHPNEAYALSWMKELGILALCEINSLDGWQEIASFKTHGCCEHESVKDKVILESFGSGWIAPRLFVDQIVPIRFMSRE